jgi:hypothetical protein
VPVRLRSDVVAVLADWKAGKTVRGPELGHIHRMKEHPGLSPLIDDSVRIHRDQDRAYAYCFAILQHWQGLLESQRGDLLPTWEQFSASCDNDVEPAFREGESGLNAEELDGAESLAWKAILMGWKKAVDGFPDAHYIEVSRPKQETST